MSLIKLPLLNPLHLTDIAMANPVKYNSKHIADWQFPDTIRYWEQHVRNWPQPWQLSDTIPMQFVTELGPVTVTVLNEDKEPLQTFPLTQGAQDFFNPDAYIWESNLDISGFAEGFYYLAYSFGSPVKKRFLSNLLYFGALLPNTMLIEFHHRKQRGDVYFETGWKGQMRLFSTLDYENANSNSVIYSSQFRSAQLLDDKPADLYRWFVGSSEGVPPWMMPKLKWMIGCSTFKLDGRSYVKAQEGTQFEKVEEKDYPLKGWNIVLQDKFNRASAMFDSTTGVILDPDEYGSTPGGGGSGGGAIRGTVKAAVIVEGLGFVADDNGGQFYKAEDVEKE